MAQQSTKRKFLGNALKIVISLAGVAFLIHMQDMSQVLQLLKNMNWFPFAGALLLMLLGSFVRAYRWGSLVWALGVHVRWSRLIALYFVGAFFSLFLPTGVGGDAVKMYELSRDEGKTAAAISSVVVDRFLGLMVLFAMALLSLIGDYKLVIPEVRIIIALVFVACLIMVLLLLQRTWLETWGRRLRVGSLLGRFNILRELYQSFHLYGTAALLRGVGASLVWNLLLIVSYYLLGRAVDIDMSLWYYFLFVPVISAALMVPSVGGLGIREWATVLLFKQVGVDESQALALALAYDITLLVNGLIGAIIYIRQGMKETRQ
jgi:hypothetical protein